LLSLYKEAHPDVRAVKRKIDALEAAGAVAGTGKEKTGEGPVSLEVAKVQAKIAATQARVASFEAQIKALRTKLASFEQQLLQTPQGERGLVTLMRDHESAQKKYEEIRAKQINARIAENLEGENKAERFALLEPPIYPDHPSKPDRVKILLIGLFAAAAGGVGLGFLLESLNQRIRGAEALSITIRQRPLAVIPYITINEEVSGRKRQYKKIAIAVLAVILIAGVLVHVLYMNLDILMMKIIARFG